MGEREMEKLFSEESTTMEEYWKAGQCISDLQPDEEAFAESTMKAADANPESAILQRLALRAIARAVRVSKAALGDASGDALVDRWCDFVQKARRQHPQEIGEEFWAKWRSFVS